MYSLAKVKVFLKKYAFRIHIYNYISVADMKRQELMYLVVMVYINFQTKKIFNFFYDVFIFNNCV